MVKSADTAERLVRELNGHYFLQREVAAALNCSISLLAKVRGEDPRLGASGQITWRGRPIHLYTREDVAQLEEHFRTRWTHLAVDPSPGHDRVPGTSATTASNPRLFTQQEARERQTRHSKAGYWQAQVHHQRRAGRLAQAERAQHNCDLIRSQLRLEHLERLGYAPGCERSIDLTVS